MAIKFENAKSEDEEEEDQAARRASQQKKRNSIAFKRTSVQFPSHHSESEDTESDDPIGSKNKWLIKGLQASLVVLMLCAVIGTCYYAISNSNDTGRSRHRFNSSNPYTPDFTQFSEDGTVVMSYHGEIENTIDTYPSFWYQSKQNRTLQMKLNKDTIAYVNDTTLYLATIDEYEKVVACKSFNISYHGFLKQLSLVDLYDRHSEVERYQGGQEVYVFEGAGTNCTFLNKNPFLVQAFGSAEDGRLTEIHSHYTPERNDNLAAITYSYHNMKMGTPEANPFMDIPSICLENQ
ncbi:unnamed protein product [Bursaphelenchus okinawaensis]|uniref:Uncharacterized protein n=1 Tax=Bursaphelenchus okinawaensis TaxID=465554 RepID=A0A811K9W5_9BILA|nr:unnamed protein product [Bursaphelenchus okinawaensis]CAG9097954.1 unnamed protein product [Bursaphelenchus okinawaensis]